MAKLEALRGAANLDPRELRDQSEYAAWVVGEALGIPVFTLTFGRLPQPDDDLEAAGDALQELRRGQGLGPIPELSTLYAGPVRVPAPKSYVDPRRRANDRSSAAVIGTTTRTTECRARTTTCR